MSLQVWLPLTGSIINQGLAEITTAASGATVNTSGKLGSCYSFDGSDDYISLTGQCFYDIIKGSTQPFSLVLWVYRADATRAILFGDYGLSGTINFNLELTTAHQVHFYWGGSPDYNAPSTFVTANAWTHVAVTYDGSNLKFYINGALTNTRSGALSAKSKTSGSYYLGRDSRTGITVLNGRMNDFRLYDHCLSVKEVRELAKGLVLHYKLDDPYVEGTTNYLTAAGSCANWRDYTASTWAMSIDSTCAIGNYKITYSAYINNTTNVDLRVRCSPLLVAGSYSTLYGNWVKAGTVGWSTLTCDLTDSATYTGSFYPYVSSSVAGTIPAIPNFQVLHAQAERNDHQTAWTLGGTTRAADTTVYDCSGFHKNGTVLNSISAAASTGRYGASTIFNGTNAKIRLPVIDFSGMANSYTFAWWQYNTGSGNMPWGFSNGNRLNVYHTSPLCWNTGDGSSNPFKDGNTTVPYSAVQNAWHHMAVTGDGTSAKLYIDGVYRGTATTYKAITGTQIYLSGWNTGTSYTFNGSKEADFRIYATALSAADVAELYHTEAVVDRNSAVYAREVVEL